MKQLIFVIAVLVVLSIISALVIFKNRKWMSSASSVPGKTDAVKGMVLVDDKFVIKK